MALMNLKSNLSWYGKSAPGFKPNADRSDTRFNNEGVSPSVLSSGYDNYGNVLSPAIRHAADSFIIDDVTHSDRGLASRAAQLGNGSKFPISPEGNVHTFDLARTGFNSTLKYEDSFGVLSGNAGLANTYIAESPIDDMYNKFNLRDDATPNPGYAKQPFILRGIQREGSSDPQRWGLGETTAGEIASTIDLPRGGILTAGERSAIDAVRIGKFLISPRGVGFLARQFGYQLMNPNIENPVDGSAIGLPGTQIYNPLSAPLQAAVNGLLGSGKIRRDIGDVAPLISNYESIKNTQNIINIGAGPISGRMIRLYDQWKDEDSSNVWTATVAPKGPGSILGIGTSQHSRSVFTDIKGQEFPLGGLPSLLKVQTSMIAQSLGLPVKSIGNYEAGLTSDKFNRYSYDKPYEGETEVEVFPNGGGRNVADTTVNEVDFTNYETNAYDDFPDRKPFSKINFDFRTKEDYVTSDDELSAAKEKLKDFDGGGKSVGADESGTEDVGKKRYKTNTYDELKSVAESRTVDTTLINDFRSKDGYIVGAEEETIAKEKLENFDGGGFAEAPADLDGKQQKSPTQLGYYKLTAYDAIKSRAEINSVTGKRAAETPSFTDDFKQGFAGSNHSDYNSLNSFGYVDYDPQRSTITSQADSVQSGEFGGEVKKDLIDFYFRPLRTTDSYLKERELIQFRAYINAINDSFAPGWDENQDQGRADSKIMLAGWSRSISLDFLVPIHSSDELESVWNKLDELARLTYPVYVPGKSFTGTYVQVTVGDLYRNVPMYVTDISYDWDNETPWETIQGKQVPRYTNVSMTLGWIGIQRPEYDAKAFSLNGRT